MQANNQINLTKDHLEVLQYLDSLFTRWSLRKNSYLSKHMKSNLQIPLYIIAQQRRIAQITQSESIIIQFKALKLCQFVQVKQQSRMVVIVDLPTLKFQDQPNMIKMQNLVKILIKQKANQDKSKTLKPLQYIISSKTQDGFYYITLKTKRLEDANILKQLAQKFNKQNQQKLKYIQQPLYDDIKQSVTKIRKSRSNNPNYPPNVNNTNRYNHYDDKNSKNSSHNNQINMPVYTRQNMMMMYPNVYYQNYNSMTPEQINMYMMQNQQQHQQQTINNSPGPFIRKAIQSQDQQQSVKTQKNKGEEGQSNKTGKQTKQILQQSIESNQNNKKANMNQNANSYSTQAGSSSGGWKNNQKKYEQKGNQQKKKNGNQKQKKQEKKQQKIQKSKVVLDDNDFPSIE